MSGFDLPDGTSEIFFALGLDDPNQLESPREIRFYAHAIARVRAHQATQQAKQIERILPAAQISRDFAKVSAREVEYHGTCRTPRPFVEARNGRSKA